MRPCHSSGNNFLVMLLLGSGMLAVAQPGIAQNVVGQVSDVENYAYVIRNGNDENEIKKPDDVRLGDIVGVNKRPRGSKLTIQFKKRGGTEAPWLEINRGGRVKLESINDAIVKCELDHGSYTVNGPPQPCEPVTPDIGRIEDEHTRYEIDVQASSTRVFVHEGAVSVFSTNPDYPEPRLVSAGEWVRARKGEEIPPPKRFTMALGPGSGSSECIYSDCKLVNSLLIPARPVVTPGVLIPPPPNPPGRQ